MMDKMKEEINGQKKSLIEKDEQLSQRNQQIDRQFKEIEQLKKLLAVKIYSKALVRKGLSRKSAS